MELGRTKFTVDQLEEVVSARVSPLRESGREFSGVRQRRCEVFLGSVGNCVKPRSMNKTDFAELSTLPVSKDLFSREEVTSSDP